MEFFIRYRWQSIGAAALMLIVFLTFLWRPEAQVAAHQAAFLRAVENGKARRLDELIAVDYADPWGLDRFRLILACADFRRCFVSVWLPETEPKIEWRSGVALYSAQLRVEGTPVGPGQFVRQEANAIRSPWTFVWRGTPGMPWRWRLLRIENPDVPSLQGYDPGAMRELLDTP